MNIGTPLTQFDFGDPTGLFSLDVNKVLGEEWGEIQDIEIITLKQYLLDQASEYAWTISANVDEIDALADVLVMTKFNKAREFVAIKENKFIIGINAPSVNKATIKYAFDLLSKIEHLKERRFVEFGETITVYETQS